MSSNPEYREGAMISHSSLEIDGGHLMSLRSLGITEGHQQSDMLNLQCGNTKANVYPREVSLGNINGKTSIDPQYTENAEHACISSKPNVTEDSGIFSMDSRSLLQSTESLKPIEIPTVCDKIRDIDINQESKRDPGMNGNSKTYSQTYLEKRKILQMTEQDEDGDTQLHNAIVQGLTRIAVYIIQIISNVVPNYLNCPNLLLETPLHLAVHTRSLTVVHKLVSAGADVMALDKNGNTPVHIACQKGYDDILKVFMGNCERCLLMKCVYMYNYFGQTCLHLTSYDSSNLVVRQLIQYGIDVNIAEKLYGYTILHVAVETRNTELLKELLRTRGVDRKVTSYGGLTPLMLAYSRGFDKIAEQMQGCD